MIVDRFDTVVCAATGPSFSIEQARYIEQARADGKCRVIAINDNWKLLPNADILYAADGKWWDRYLPEVKASRFKGELWTVNKRAAPGYIATKRPRTGVAPRLPALTELNYIRCTALEILSDSAVFGGKTSGCHAIGLARFKYRPARILPVGYDMQRTYGKQHHFGDHPEGLSNNLPFAEGAVHLGRLAEAMRADGIEIINCSRETALTCFPRMKLEDIL